MIARDAEPIRNVPVYKRFDPNNPGRKAVITLEDVINGGGREPDPAIYERNPLCDVWVLKNP